MFENIILFIEIKIKLLIIFILIFFFFIFMIYLLNLFSFNFSIKSEKNIIKLSDCNEYYANEEEKYKSLKKGQIFFNVCIKGKLIKKIPNLLNSNNDKPLISVIIPVYNTESKIKYVVRSAQNQNISNIEIILVNDFSNEETYKAIDELMKEDIRVKCINNKKNMGTLYSRCIGTLKAKGKYIFPLDNDDFFFDESLFYVITNIAEKENFDIVEFRGASRDIYDLPPNIFENTNYSNHQNNLVLYQPELGQYARKIGNQFVVNDCFLWAKCIRKNIYIKTINYLGKEVYYNKIIWGEDLITSFVLFRVAKSFKFIGRYGIFRYLNNATSTYHTSESLVVFSKIIYLNIILKFTDNSFFDKKYVSFRALGFIRSFKYIYLTKTNFKYLKKIVKIILDNNYIYTSEKNKIKLAFLNVESKYNKT